MKTKEKNHTVSKVKKTAAVSAVALLTAASVATGSLFSTPAALLSDAGTPASAYSVSVDLDGADDDGAGVEQDESGEAKKRGIRSALRARILRLPLAARLLAVLPLWALGSVILAGAFLFTAKAVFPDLPLKKILNRRSLVALLLGASALAAADAVFGATWEDYTQVRNIVLSVGFFAALSCAVVPFALREQKRRLALPEAKLPKKPDKLIFTDGVDSYTVRVPEIGG